jgi:hypothetical protein
MTVKWLFKFRCCGPHGKTHRQTSSKLLSTFGCKAFYRIQWGRSFKEDENIGPSSRRCISSVWLGQCHRTLKVFSLSPTSPGGPGLLGWCHRNKHLFTKTHWQDHPGSSHSSLEKQWVDHVSQITCWLQIAAIESADNCEPICGGKGMKSISASGSWMHTSVIWLLECHLPWQHLYLSLNSKDWVFILILLSWGH